jgi:hypothetical protein
MTIDEHPRANVMQSSSRRNNEVVSRYRQQFTAWLDAAGMLRAPELLGDAGSGRTLSALDDRSAPRERRR